MNIQNLPEELLAEIVHWLPLKGLASTMQVNRKFHRICRDNRLWRRHQEFPYRLKTDKSREKSSVGTWLSNIKGEKAPLARLCHTAIVYCGFMYIHGGHTTLPQSQNFDSIKSDLWKFNLITKRWDEVQQREPKLPAKTEHSAVLWGSKMWMFGGFNGTAFTNDVSTFDMETGETTTVITSGDIPSPRSAHVALAFGGKMWVFGGWNGTEQNNDLFAFDFETLMWERVKPADGVVPPPRCSHAAALAPAKNSFFLYGGCGGRLVNYLADLWQFNFETLTWTSVSKLHAGSRMRMVEYRNRLYMYGGWNSQVHFNSFHEFDIESGTWREIDHGYSADSDQGKMGQFSLCLFNHKMYQFAGYDHASQTYTNSMHVFRMGKPDFTEGSVSAR